jgi:hypothetical protein
LYFSPYKGNIYTHGHTITVNKFAAEEYATAAIWFQNSELHVKQTFSMWPNNDTTPFKVDVNLFLGPSASYARFSLQEGFELNEVTLAGEIAIYTDMPAKKITFLPGASADLRGNKLTAETFNVKGTEDEFITLYSGTFSKTSGTVVAEYVSIVDLTATGGAAFYADKNSVDHGGNTGWIFSSKEVQHIAFADIPDKAYGTIFNLTATSSSGLAVAYAVASGPATISGNTITITGVGEVTVLAFQEGDDAYMPAEEVFQSFTVARANQSTNFAIGSLTYGQAPVTINTTPGETTNEVVYTVVSGPATVSGDVLTITGAGTVVVKATQEGSENYNAAEVIKEFSIAKAAQTISFTPPSGKTFGDAMFDLTATGGASGNPVTFAITSGPATITNNTVTITGAGTIVVKASQAGNDNYEAAEVSKEMAVAKATQAIVFTSLPVRTFGDAAFTVSATGGLSGNPIVFSVASGPATLAGSTVTLTGPGPVTINAWQAENNNYTAANDVEQTFCVNPVKPSVTLTGLDTETPVLTSTAGEGYQWFINGTAIPGAAGKSHTATEAGVYTVATNASNCVSVTSDAQVLIVTGIEGAPETFVKAYPNPVMNELMVDMTAVNSHKEISVALYDVSGRLMTTAKGKGTVSIPMQSYRSGQYAVVVHFDMQRITKHIIKK